MYVYTKNRQQNFKLAQDKAKNTKQPCVFCGVQRDLANIRKHENSCYLNPKNLKPCSICGNPIKNYKSSKTCGYSCSNTKFRSGPNNPNCREESYRTTCFHFHQKKCVVCNETNIVEVHHLDENNKNNEPSNLIPLCPTHHQYWHSRFRPLIQEQVDSYVLNWINEQCQTGGTRTHGNSAPNGVV